MAKFKIEDFEMANYFQIPYALMQDEYYSKLSAEAKIAYGLLLDRLKLSFKNKGAFTDDNGNVYVIYTNEQLQLALNVRSNKTLVKIKKELIDHNLLSEKRQGIQKPNLLYPQKVRSVKNTLQEVQILHFNGVKNTLQEVQNLHTSHTNNNHTNNSHTENNHQPSENILFSMLKEAFGEDYVGQTVSERTNGLVKEFGHDLVVRALEETILQRGSSIKYTETILKNWASRGYKTVEQVNANQEQGRGSYNRNEGKVILDASTRVGGYEEPPF